MREEAIIGMWVCVKKPRPSLLTLQTAFPFNWRVVVPRFLCWHYFVYENCGKDEINQFPEDYNTVDSDDPCCKLSILLRCRSCCSFLF